MDVQTKEGPDAAAETGAAKKPARYRRSRKRGAKRLVWLALLLAALAAAAFYLWRLFGAEEERVALTGVTEYGALNKAVEGSGTTAPQDSETYSLPSMNAAVSGWYFNAGDTVEVGDLLFEQDDSDLDEQISTLRYGAAEISGITDYESDIEDQKALLQDYAAELAELRESLELLDAAAPIDGYIESVSALKAGDEVRAGDALFTVVDDTRMTLTQYFSYADRDAVETGMPARVSVPARMLSLAGTVTEIQYVERPSAEGLRCFAVTVTVDNPGALTAATKASTVLVGEDGDIYPASFPEDPGLLCYADSAQVQAEVSGELLSAGARQYARVAAGEVLYRIDSSDIEAQIENLEERAAAAEKQIDKFTSRIEALTEQIADLEETRAQYKRRSEIAGKVISSEYSQMRGGFYVGSLTIYNMDTMTVSVTFDELDADYLYQGMPVQVYRMSADERVYYDGVLTYLSLEATSSSGGVSTFAGTVTIDSKGELASGVTVYYSIDVGDTTEGVLAPIAALRTTEDGAYYVVARADAAPENAIEIPDGDFPEGYWPVSVEVGASNGASIYIESGVAADTALFLRYLNSAPAGGDSTSQYGADEDAAGGTEAYPDFGGMGGFEGGFPGGFESGGFPGGMGGTQSGARSGGMGG